MPNAKQYSPYHRDGQNLLDAARGLWYSARCNPAALSCVCDLSANIEFAQKGE